MSVLQQWIMCMETNAAPTIDQSVARGSANSNTGGEST